MRAHFDPHGNLPTNVRKYLRSRYISLGLLDAQTAKLLLEKEVWELELFERTWLSLEDCLLLSSPEAFLTQKGQIRKYFRYCVSALTYGGFDVFIKIHKMAMNYIEKTVLNIKTAEPVTMPGCFPGWDPTQQKLVNGPAWLMRCLERGKPIHKGEVTRLAHLCSMRGFPPARKTTQEKSLVAHHTTLTTPAPVLSEERYQLAYALAKRVAQRVQKDQVAKALKRPEHVSLTNRSSFLFTREDGGRAAEVGILFEKWAQEPSKGGETQHPFGYSVFEIKGMPRWKTFIMEDLRSEEEDLEFGQKFESRLAGECVAGLNQNVGFQLLQMAFESLQSKGIISNGEVSNERLGFMRSSCVSEPGGKARIYTIQEWDRTIFLQPLGHFLVETLSTLPQCESGLKRANTGWDWANSFKRVDPEATAAMLTSNLLTSDLETATDFCDQRLCRSMLKGYIDGLGVGKNLYLQLSIDLLTTGLNLITNKP